MCSKPYVRREQIRTRGAYREPDHRRARSRISTPVEHKIQVAGNWTTSGAFTAEPFGVRNPQGHARHQPRFPRSSEERAGTSQRRSGTACRDTGNRDTKHATRPVNAEGNQASTSGVPTTPALRSSRHRHAENGAGPAMQVRSHTFAKNRGPHELERQSRIARQKFELLMLNSGSEIWVNASASTVRRIGCRTGKKPATSEI
jgi:hypothetical protein